MKHITILVIILWIAVWSVGNAVNISGGSTITEEFSIGTAAISTLPVDWKADKQTSVRTVGTYTAAVNATERAGGNNMATTAANGIYNYGAGDAAAATDRAIGWLSSSSATKSGNLYVTLVNNGTSLIGNFTISYDVEKYRKGSNAAGFSVQMYYSTDGAVWTSAGPDFLVSIPADADNTGYAATPGATLSVSLKSLPQTLDASATLYLAWNYSVTTGSTTSNAQALGIDNVVITANSAGPSIPTLTTTAITGISQTTATSGGTIISNGGSDISARGVCWNTTGLPSNTDAHSTDGTGSGTFVSSLINLTMSTIYHVRAYATNDLGTGYGNELTFTTSGNTPPAAPVATDATSITTDTFIANWNPVTEAASYRLDVSVSAIFASFVTGYQDLTVTGTTQQVSGLVAASTYYYRVRAVNTNGTSDDSNAITVITASIPVTPEPPVAIAATSVASTGFTANWNASLNATSYRLDVSTSNTFTTFVTGYDNLTVVGLFQTVSGLAPTSTYYYRVRAANDAGTSLNSNIITAVTTESGTIALSEGFEEASTASPPVGWTLSSPGSYILTNVSNAHGGTNYAGINALDGWVRTPVIDSPTEITFWVRASGSASNFSITLQASTNAVDWTDIATYAANGTDTGAITLAYSQKVASLNLTGSNNLRWYMTARTGGSCYIDDVEVSSGSIIPTPPAIPVATTATSITSSSFVANWITATNATSYRFDASLSNTFDTFLPGYQDLTITSISQSVTGLTANTNYYYRVRAFNSAGTSDNSNVITVFTSSTPIIPEAPVAIAATNISSVGFTANWNASSNAASYRLDVSTTDTFSNFVPGYHDLATNEVSQTVSGLSALTTYYYRVRAVNDAGASANSNTISLTTTNTEPFDGYYNPVIGLTGNALKAGLTSLVSTNTYNSYDGARVIMFQQLDNHNGVVRCVYTGQDFSIAPDYSGQSSPNTEHTYAQSWFTASASIEKADLHHLFVTESTVNSSRGNLPFGKVIAPTTTYASYNGYVSKRGTDQFNQVVFEPADQHKGDCARALLYFNVRYAEPLTIDNVDMLPACIQWNYLDPPTADEVTRNTMIQTTLTNRNPFVDHPEYVTSIYVGSTNNTMLNFEPTASSVPENVGTVHLTIDLQNPNVFASTATVVLKSGNPAHIGNFTPVNINFPSNSITPQIIDINVTDDDITDGNETFVFEIQDAQGGYYAIPGLDNDYALTVEDNEGGIPVPVALPAYQTSNTSFIAHWLPVNGISSYALDVSPVSDFSSFLTGYNNQVVMDTTYFVINLEQGHSYYYRVRSIVGDNQSTNSNVINITLTGNNDPIVILVTGIHSIYPNPFNPETTIQYALSKAGFVNMDIYNVRGQNVKTLVSQIQPTGNYSITWNGKDDQGKKMGSGIYYVKMNALNESSIRKVVLLK